MKRKQQNQPSRALIVLVLVFSGYGVPMLIAVDSYDRTGRQALASLNDSVREEKGGPVTLVQTVLKVKGCGLDDWICQMEKHQIADPDVYRQKRKS